MNNQEQRNKVPLLHYYQVCCSAKNAHTQFAHIYKHSLNIILLLQATSTHFLICSIWPQIKDSKYETLA